MRESLEDGRSAIRVPKKWPGSRAPFSHVHPSTSTVTWSLVRSGRVLFMIAFQSPFQSPSHIPDFFHNFETISSNSHNSTHAICPMTFQVPIHCCIPFSRPFAFLHFMLSILSSSPSCPNFLHFMLSDSSFRVPLHHVPWNPHLVHFTQLASRPSTSQYMHVPWDLHLVHFMHLALAFNLQIHPSRAIHPLLRSPDVHDAFYASPGLFGLVLLLIAAAAAMTLQGGRQ